MAGQGHTSLALHHHHLMNPFYGPPVQRSASPHLPPVDVCVSSPDASALSSVWASREVV